jgi:hypothetical protein
VWAGSVIVAGGPTALVSHLRHRHGPGSAARNARQLVNGRTAGRLHCGSAALRVGCTAGRLHHGSARSRYPLFWQAVSAIDPALASLRLAATPVAGRSVRPRVAGTAAGEDAAAAVVQLFCCNRHRGGRVRRCVLIQPLSCEPDGLVPRQPGPVGSTGPHRDPNRIAMNMFFDRKQTSVRHDSVSFEMRKKPSLLVGRPTITRGFRDGLGTTVPATNRPSFGEIQSLATFLPLFRVQPQ